MEVTMRLERWLKKNQKVRKIKRLQKSLEKAQKQGMSQIVFWKDEKAKQAFSWDQEKYKRTQATISEKRPFAIWQIDTGDGYLTVCICMDLKKIEANGKTGLARLYRELDTRSVKGPVDFI